jgi:hypothetical protein
MKPRDLFRKTIYGLRQKFGGCWSSTELAGIVNQSSRANLTRTEEAAIKDLWGEIDRPYHRAMKALAPFDARYCSNKYYVRKILSVLNPQHLVHGLQDKNLYDIWFGDKDGLKFPKAIVKNINGVFFDREMNVLTEEVAIASMLSEKAFIVKPSVQTGGGKNVRKISSPNKDLIYKLMKDYGENYIVQKVVEQHPSTAQFNPTSLNTFRVTTLFLNGRASVLCPILRFGAEGKSVDNASSGGFYIGIEANGVTKQLAYNRHLACKEMSIVHFDFFSKIQETSILAHRKYFPHIGILGWDFAVDATEQIICIEVNAAVPGIFEWQFCDGPIFGDRTEEVLEYAKANPVWNMPVVL